MHSGMLSLRNLGEGLRRLAFYLLLSGFCIMPKGFVKEIKRVTITDSKGGNKEEEEALVKIGQQKLDLKESSDKPEVAHTILDEKKFAEMIAVAVNNATSAIATQKDKEIEQAKQQLETQYQEKEDQFKQQLETVTQTLEATQQHLQESKETANKLGDLFKLTGSTQPAIEAPNVNTKVAIGYDKTFGTVKEVIDLCENLMGDGVIKVTEKGSPFVDFDKQQLDDYVREHRRQLMKDFTEWGRKRGWFQGGSTVSVKEAATTAADLPGGFLETLSSMLRVTHRPGFVFWQFPSTSFNFQKGMGQVIDVGRFAYLNSSNNPDDYQLSGSGTFSPIVSTSDPLQSGIVQITLKEWGRGKAGTGMSPVAVPAFVMFASMYELMVQLDQKLGHDYAVFEDKKIRSYWNATSRIVYNDKGVVTTNPANVGAGDKGIVNSKFFINLFAYMKILLIEPLRDGNYLYVTHPTGLAQYQDALGSQWEAPSPDALKALTNILNPSFIPDEEFSRISGYFGLWNGFHLFASNAFSVGAAGTEGVQMETLGVGSTLTRTSYAAGAGTVGRGVGMPMELREDNLTNFDRITPMTWISYEGFDPLDVDPVGYNDTSAVPQQLRVIKVRTTDTEL